MKKIIFWSSFVALAACNSGSNAPVLTLLTQVSSGTTQCPSGGVTLTAGPDTNGNGTLDADEVKQTSEICNGIAGAAGDAGGAGPNGANGTDGTNGSNGMGGMSGTNGMNGQAGAQGDAGAAGANVAVRTTVLSAGDANCPNGGVRIETGLDTDVSGALEGGEVQATQFVCNGTWPYYPATVTAPGGPVGTSVIEAKGGNGITNAGGNGGALSVGLEYGSLGGAVKVFKSGSPDAGFAVPDLPFTAGVNPMTVTNTFVLQTFNTINEGLMAAVPYFKVNFDPLIYSADAGVVTSISVSDTGTLVFGTDDSGPYYPFNKVSGSIRNAGTMRVSYDGLSPRELALSALGDVVMTAGSLLDVSGRSDGGSCDQLDLISSGQMVLSGTINGTGGSGGGRGARLAIRGEANLFATGLITAQGGANDAGVGGAGNQITLTGKAVRSSATLDASGGVGTSAGGAHNGITVQSINGPLIFSGSIASRSGDCTDAACFAGSSDQTVALRANNGDLVFTGSIDVSGGSALGSNGHGANGGNIALTSSEYSNRSHDPAGSLHVSGSLRANGGDGDWGGNGGVVTITCSPEFRPEGQEVELLGYSGFDSSGGNSSGALGGTAGYVAIYTNASPLKWLPDGDALLGPSGPVVNSVDIINRSGDGTACGNARNIILKTQTSVYFERPEERVINSGTLDVSSGTSSANGPHGSGYITLYGTAGVENHGALSANGADGAGVASTAASGGTIQILAANGPLVNDGQLSCNGGDDPGAGQNGGTVALEGKTVANSGAVSATGGNGGVFGGNGGSFYAFTSGEGHSVVTGSETVDPGTGPTGTGEPGFVAIDLYPWSF